MHPKKISVTIIAVALAFVLAGCSVATNTANGINSITAALTSPAAVQSAANIRTWGAAFACFVSNGTLAATKLETLINAKVAAQTTTGEIYTVSAFACSELGGTPSVAPVAATAIKT